MPIYIPGPGGITITLPDVSAPSPSLPDITIPSVAFGVNIGLYEKNGSRGFVFPWNPDAIEYTSGQASVATHEIIKKGPVDMSLGVGLKELKWQGIFPGIKRKNDYGMKVCGNEIQKPSYYTGIIEDWKSKGSVLNVLITNYPVNFDCYVYDFNYDITGAFGDIEYTIHLKEKKEVTVIVTKEVAESGSSTDGEDTKRPAEKTESYTIKSGDSMWSIAQQYLGDGSRWRELYEANKEVLDQAAADMGHSSNDGTWIFPGTTIAIPQE